MMKRIALLTMMLAMGMSIRAQRIQIKKFVLNPMSLEASVNRLQDKNGDYCAIIHFYVPDRNYVIEPNAGVIRIDTLINDMRMWVPKGTERVTVKREGMLPLIRYEIPIEIESLKTYEATVEIVNEPSKTPRKHLAYMGAGYNVMSIAGPSLSLGFNLNHHQIELGAVYGLNKTDDLYFYDSNGKMIAGYRYHAMRAQLRYGYDIELSKYFSITPQAGCAYNYYMGENAISADNHIGYKNAQSLSAIGALRLSALLSKSLKFYVSPEYDVSLKKDNTCGLISWYDSTMKKWNTGLSLNVGLLVFL